MIKRILCSFVGAGLGVLILFSIAGLNNFSNIDLLSVIAIIIGAILGYIIGAKINFNFISFRPKIIAIVVILMILTSFIPYRLGIPGQITLMKNSPTGPVMCGMTFEITFIVGWPLIFSSLYHPNTCTDILVFNPIAFAIDFLIFLVIVSFIGYISGKKKQRVPGKEI